MRHLLSRPNLRCTGLRLLLAGAFTVLAVACARGEVKARADSARVEAADSSPTLPAAALSRRVRPAPLPTLSRAADSVLAYLVFAPVGQPWFTAMARTGRMLVDVGRVDIDVRKDSARAAAYREAVEKRGTVPLGTTFRLRGAWGAFDVKAASVEAWDGRIVLRVTGPPALDSIVRAKVPAIATAFRTDSLVPASADSCDRGAAIDPALAARLGEVRDSLERELRIGPQPPYTRLQAGMALATSQVAGCFGIARAALVVTLKAANMEWLRERLVLVDTLGRVMPMRVNDYRFRAHELVQAFDADGDGVDDLATRASMERTGAITVLVVDLRARRATRLAAGFDRERQ